MLLLISQKILLFSHIAVIWYIAVIMTFNLTLLLCDNITLKCLDMLSLSFAIFVSFDWL